MSRAATAVPHDAKFYSVPAGTRSARCNGSTCGKQIFFIVNPRTGRPMPIDCDVEGGEAPSATTDKSQLDMLSATTVHDGRGVSHFLTCPDAEQFSKRGAR